MKTAIVDLDGTVSDNSHREHLIEGEEKEWEKYLEKVGQDSPNGEVIDFVNELSESYRIVFLSARSDHTKEETIEWLNDHEVYFDDIIMLEYGNWSIEDQEFKKEELQDIENPVLAIDDKEEVCEMFEEAGLKVYKVEDGRITDY